MDWLLDPEWLTKIGRIGTTQQYPWTAQSCCEIAPIGMPMSGAQEDDEHLTRLDRAVLNSTNKLSS